MTLGVQSYPELYTLLIGWDLYGKLWTVLTQTGIAFLPFVAMLIRNFAKPYQSQESKDAAGTSLRRMQLELMATLLLIVLGVVPCFSITASTVSYTPLCHAQNSVHAGDTGTTWDKAFAIPQTEIRVPVWWYAVIAVSEGVTSAANTMIGCVPNLRKNVTQVDMAQISDPQIKTELQQFAQMCYAKARLQYYRDVQDNHLATVTPVQAALKEYGVADLNWFGSHALQNVYYKNPDFKAQTPIPGFTYNPNNDLNADLNRDHPPQFDTPNCYTWWNDVDQGLKKRLYDVMPKSFWDDVSHYFVNAEVEQDHVLQHLIQNTDLGYQLANDQTAQQGLWSLSRFGSLINQFDAYPKLYAAVEAAPIIQALLQLLVYVFLPLGLVFSSYRAGSFVTGAMIIFSLIFWSFIWHLVGFADHTLMQALYGESWFAKQSPSATLADLITGTLIIVAPLFWFSFMGAIGVAVGDFVSSAAIGLNRSGAELAPMMSNKIKSGIASLGKMLF